MSKNILRDQRGVAMVLEIALVAVVIGLVGLAVYQATRSTQTAKQTNTAPAADSKQGLANSAAAILEEDSKSEVSASAQAESLTSEVTAADSDVSTLGGSANVGSF